MNSFNFWVISFWNICLYILVGRIYFLLGRVIVLIKKKEEEFLILIYFYIKIVWLRYICSLLFIGLMNYK